MAELKPNFIEQLVSMQIYIGSILPQLFMLNLLMESDYWLFHVFEILSFDKNNFNMF